MGNWRSGVATNKTVVTGDDVAGFLATLEPAERRADAQALAAAMEQVTGEPPAMWGPAIIGFGSVHYRYDSGREGDMPQLSFSPRAKELVLYGLGGADRHADLLARLGKFKTGKGCLKLARLADVDAAALEALLAAGWVDRSAA